VKLKTIDDQSLGNRDSFFLKKKKAVSIIRYYKTIHIEELSIISSGADLWKKPGVTC
jgi:hypothetical protein